MVCKFLAGGLIVLVLTACGGGSTATHPAGPAPTASGKLDTGRIARAIEASIVAQRHIHATVMCPRGEPLRKGWHFVCLATTRDGQTPFVVTEVDNRGSTTYVGK